MQEGLSGGFSGRPAARAAGVGRPRVTVREMSAVRFSFSRSINSRSLARYGSLSSLELSIADLNRQHAKDYDALGLAEYEAIEAFQRRTRP